MVKTILEVAGRGSGRSPYTGDVESPSKATELWGATHGTFGKDSLAHLSPVAASLAAEISHVATFFLMTFTSFCYRPEFVKSLISRN